VSAIEANDRHPWLEAAAAAALAKLPGAEVVNALDVPR
jgi:hypothetical protein